MVWTVLGTGHCAHFCCPFWKFFGLAKFLPHGHRKFQNLRLIYGATSMLLTKKLDGGQVFERNPRKTNTNI